MKKKKKADKGKWGDLGPRGGGKGGRGEHVVRYRKAKTTRIQEARSTSPMAARRKKLYLAYSKRLRELRAQPRDDRYFFFTSLMTPRSGTKDEERHGAHTSKTVQDQSREQRKQKRELK